MRIRTNSFALLGLALATLAVLAPAAHAGTYTVNACDSLGQAWGN